MPIAQNRTEIQYCIEALSDIHASFSLKPKAFILLPSILSLDICDQLCGVSLFLHSLLLAKTQWELVLIFGGLSLSSSPSFLYLYSATFSCLKLLDLQSVSPQQRRITRFSDLVHTFVWLLCRKAIYSEYSFYCILMKVALDLLFLKNTIVTLSPVLSNEYYSLIFIYSITSLKHVSS